MTPPLEEYDYIGLSDLTSNGGGGGGGGGGSGSDKINNLKQTELRLGLPGSESPERLNGSGLTLAINSLKGFGSGSKRGFSDAINGSPKWVFNGSGSEAELFSPKKGESGGAGGGGAKDGEKKAPAAKAQVVGWPPIRNSRKSIMANNNANHSKNKEDGDGNQGPGCLYVKVSMDGAPYLRKVDLKMYSNYKELSRALEKMFSCFTIGQCGSYGIPTKDGQSESLDGSENVLTYEDKDGDWMLVGDVPWDMFTETCRRLRIMKGSDAIGLAPRAMDKSKNRN